MNEAFAAAAAGPLAGIVRYSTDPIVSRDVIGDPASCVFDSAPTQASGTLVKVFGWYDNEWGAEACAAAMRSYGVPGEVITDSGWQFTGGRIRPQPVEWLFDQVFRETGIVLRHGKPHSPTPLGKIERLHKILRAELLDCVAPFESVEAAQGAIDHWVHSYNQRPQQALDMAAPARRFRPKGSSREVAVPQLTAQDDQATLPWAQEAVVVLPPLPAPHSAAVEFEARVSPSGNLVVVTGRQRLTVRPGLAGRTLTIWADVRSIHLLLDGKVLRTVASRLLPRDLATLAARGARQAGPEPAKAAIQRRSGRLVPGPGQAVELERRVQRDGHVNFDGARYQVAAGYAGSIVTLWLDGHLMHAVASGALIGIWPSPVTVERAARMNGARVASTPLSLAPSSIGSMGRPPLRPGRRPDRRQLPADEARPPPRRQASPKRSMDRSWPTRTNPARRAPIQV